MPNPTDQMLYFFRDIVELEPTADVKKWTGVCKFCTHRVSDALGTTSNFNRHCKKHPNQLAQFEQSKKRIGIQPPLLQTFAKQSKYDRNDPHQIRITDSYVKNIVIKCGAPIFMVEQEEFRAFMNDVHPKWIPCGGKWISSKKLPQLFTVVKEKLVLKLAQV